MWPAWSFHVCGAIGGVVGTVCRDASVAYSKRRPPIQSASFRNNWINAGSDQTLVLILLFTPDVNFLCLCSGQARMTGRGPSVAAPSHTPVQDPQVHLPYGQKGGELG